MKKRDVHNIKSVTIDCESDTNLMLTIEQSNRHRPADLAQWLQRDYSFERPETAGRALDLKILMTDADREKITFTLTEHRTPDKTGAFEQSAAVLTEFTLSPAAATDTKGWNEYKRGKSEYGGRVFTPDFLLKQDAQSLDAYHEDLHDFLAQRLRRTLERKGMVYLGEPHVLRPERAMIGIFLEYQMLRRISLPRPRSDRSCTP